MIGLWDSVRSLKQAVRAFVNQHDGPLEYKLIVRVYANVKGLFKTYRDHSICSERKCLDDFIRGFNMADPLFDFVDAGSGKECADAKLKSTWPL